MKCENRKEENVILIRVPIFLHQLKFIDDALCLIQHKDKIIRVAILINFYSYSGSKFNTCII